MYRVETKFQKKEKDIFQLNISHHLGMLLANHFTIMAYMEVLLQFVIEFVRPIITTLLTKNSKMEILIFYMNLQEPLVQ